MDMSLFIRFAPVFQSDKRIVSRENKGTEREAPGPGLGICQIVNSTEVIFGDISRTR